MSKPRAGNIPPDFSGQSKILFVTEGNPIALLLTHLAGRRRSSPMKFPRAEAALAWCRRKGVMMLYCPERN